MRKILEVWIWINERIRIILLGEFVLFNCVDWLLGVQRTLFDSLGVILFRIGAYIFRAIRLASDFADNLVEDVGKTLRLQWKLVLRQIWLLFWWRDVQGLFILIFLQAEAQFFLRRIDIAVELDGPSFFFIVAAIFLAQSFQAALMFLHLFFIDFDFKKFNKLA